MAAKPAQHREHAAPSKAQIVLFWGPEFAFSITTPTDLSSARNIRARLVFPDVRRGARSGTVCFTSCWPGRPHRGGILGEGPDVRDRAPWIPGRDLLGRFVRSGPRRVGRGWRRVLHRDRNDGTCGRRAAHGRVEGSRRAQCHGAHRARRLRPRHGDVAAKPQDVVFALTYLDDELQSCTPGAQEQLAVSPRELVRNLSISSPTPAGWSSASIRAARSTNRTARFSISSPTSLARRSPTRARTSRRESAPKPSRSSIGQKRRSSATSVTNSEHRSPCWSDRLKTAWPMRPRRWRPCIGNGRKSRIAMPCDCCGW